MNNCFRYFAVTVFACLIAQDVSCKREKVKYCKMESCHRVSNVSESYDGDLGLDSEPVYLDHGACEASYAITPDCIVPSPDDECARVCRPRAIEKKTIYSRTKVPQVETVIRSCYAPKKCLSGCFRKPEFVFMFVGTKYQKRVDVGRCVGQCESEDPVVECLPTSTTTKAVQGPNGASTLDVIGSCACVNTDCYRVDHFESFPFLEADKSNKSSVIEKAGDKKNSTNNLTISNKLVNVGKCIGSCPGVIVGYDCYPSNDNCIIKFGGGEGLCVPLSITNETYTGTNNKPLSVYSIDHCGCGSG